MGFVKYASMILCLSLLIAALAFATTFRVQAEDAKCDENEAGCSLQRWMANHVKAALEKRDPKAIAHALETAARSAPDPKWNEGERGWAKIAEQGASAAKAGKLVDVKKACNDCHRTWRTEYKKQYRARSLFGDAAHGAEVFEQHCDKCHPGAGEGVGPSLVAQARSSAQIRKQVREGSTRMIAFSEERLNHRDLNSLIAYLRSRSQTD